MAHRLCQSRIYDGLAGEQRARNEMLSRLYDAVASMVLRGTYSSAPLRHSIEMAIAALAAQQKVDGWAAIVDTIPYDCLCCRTTPLHSATCEGMLGLIPGHLFRSSILDKLDSAHRSVIGIAATHNCLDSIPRELFSEERLWVRDLKGHPVISYVLGRDKSRTTYLGWLSPVEHANLLGKLEQNALFREHKHVMDFMSTG